MMATTITHIAMCPQCGNRDIRIEYIKNGQRRYRIACRCGYVTPEEPHLADCDKHVQWEPRKP